MKCEERDRACIAMLYESVAATSKVSVSIGKVVTVKSVPRILRVASTAASTLKGQQKTSMDAPRRQIFVEQNII
jgi:hypothetical protein